MRQRKYFLIDRLGLGAIAVISLGYIMFWSTFAKIHIKLSFLDFPIFIGEVLLAFCLCLLIWKWSHREWSPGRWGWAAAGYVVFILVKTFPGYAKWGPLALRDAAFFYYPAFVVFGYAFFDPDAQGRSSRRIVLAILFIVMLSGQFIFFAGFSLLAGAILLALCEKNLTVRVLLTVGILLFAPYSKMVILFQRTSFISCLVSFVFLMVMLVLFLRWKWIVKFFLVVFGGILILTLLLMAHNAGVWKTMAPKIIFREAKPAVAPWSEERPRALILYNIDGSDPYHPDTIKRFFACLLTRASYSKQECGVKVKQTTGEKYIRLHNTLKIKKDDAFFRYYIWKDMIKEYCQYRPLFGFAFGRPLRSPTIIFYGIPSPEAQDGWVGAHNSFLYMLYRGGIVGLMMVIIILAFWVGMVRDFAGLRNMPGLVLSAILLSWIVSANLFLIFELPYTAIPVWTLWGITAKYRDFVKNGVLGK